MDAVGRHHASPPPSLLPAPLPETPVARGGGALRLLISVAPVAKGSSELLS